MLNKIDAKPAEIKIKSEHRKTSKQQNATTRHYWSAKRMSLVACQSSPDSEESAPLHSTKSSSETQTPSAPNPGDWGADFSRHTPCFAS